MEKMIKKIPKKYMLIWQKSLPLLRKGRPGDDKHAAEVVNFILNYRGRTQIDKDILIPVAIMHDIGHYAILSESFKYVTGPEKLINGKLIHMLTGAKIAKDILESIQYPKEKTREIVDIISVHDADQLQGIDMEKWYNTKNKKIFHDLDSMDRYTETRILGFKKMFPGSNKIKDMLEKSLNLFFYKEFKSLARDRFNNLLK